MTDKELELPYCCGYPMEKSGSEIYCPECNTVEDLPENY